MAADRYVVLGLGQIRSAWFREVARWATASAIPVEFVKAVSLEEVRVRLQSGRAISALLVDDTIAGVDRDLVDEARMAGCAVVVVDSGRTARRWPDLGVSGVLPVSFGPTELLDALQHVARPIARHDDRDAVAAPVTASTPPSWRGRFVAVTGAPGAGRSTVAMALAQGLAADPRDVDLVCLADLALDSDQGALHDCPDVVPGVLELVEAHRGGAPAFEAIRGLTWSVSGRGYQLLLGLRRHRDWTALRARAFDAAVDGLCRCFRTVVADVDADLEGEDECGSLDVEERNVMARAACRRGDLVLVVGTAGVTGIRRLVRVLSDLHRLGVPDERLLPVVNRAPRNPRVRAEITRALAELVGGASGAALPSPAFVPERRRLDDNVRAGMPLPSGLASGIASVVRAVLDRSEHASEPVVGTGATWSPTRVEPGSLGAWAEEGIG